MTIYNHLDVQPADAAEWRTPPFTFTRDGDRWIARGSTDDKGPALTALYGARLALEEDARVNIQFLWELEEEIGSPNFEARAGGGDRRRRRRGARRLHHRLGRRLGHDLDRGRTAGDPVRPARAHGIHGGAARPAPRTCTRGRPAARRATPSASCARSSTVCYDARTGRVKIPGFYDDVAKPTAAERAGFARAGFSAKRFKAAHELTSLRPAKNDVDLMQAIMARPTFEVHGLVGGYSGPGIKTIVPHRAEAKLSTRLVPNQKPGKVFKLIKALHQAAARPTPW